MDVARKRYNVGGNTKSSASPVGFLSRGIVQADQPRNEDLVVTQIDTVECGDGSLVWERSKEREGENPKTATIQGQVVL